MRALAGSRRIGTHIRSLSIDDGEGLSPVPLPSKKPVSQLEVDLRGAFPLLFQPPDHRGCCFRRTLPIQIQIHSSTAGSHCCSLPCDPSIEVLMASAISMHHGSFSLSAHTVYAQKQTCEGEHIVFATGPLDHPHHWQTILGGKLKVPCVVSWHSHYGPAAVATQHIISHPDGHGLSGCRIDCMAACTAFSSALSCRNLCACNTHPSRTSPFLIMRHFSPFKDVPVKTPLFTFCSSVRSRSDFRAAFVT